MHTYTIAFSYPKKHKINKDGVSHKFLLEIRTLKKLQEYLDGEIGEADIEYGVTPTAPTVMTSSEGEIIGEKDRVIFKSDLMTIKFFRNELHLNPMPWNPNFEGERCSAPIYYDFEKND